jgi:hypothetical protein
MEKIRRQIVEWKIAKASNANVGLLVSNLSEVEPKDMKMESIARPGLLPFNESCKL